MWKEYIYKMVVHMIMECERHDWYRIKKFRMVYRGVELSTNEGNEAVGKE